MLVLKNYKRKMKIAVAEGDESEKNTSSLILSTTAFTDSYDHEYLPVVSVAEISEKWRQ